MLTRALGTLPRRLFAAVALLVCFAASPAIVRADQVPSISSNLPALQPRTNDVPIDSPGPVPSSGPVGVPGATTNAPTIPVGDPDTGLTTWLSGLMRQNGWLDQSRSFGLIIAVSAIPLTFLISLYLKRADNGFQISFPAMLGGFLGTFLSALPMLIFIARYDVFANLGIGTACQLALGLATSAGDTQQHAGSATPIWASNPALVCDGQLTPIGVAKLGWSLAVDLMSVQLPVPQLGSNGVWSWVLLPISAMGQNVLASLIGFSSAAIAGISIAYVAIELVGLALEAVFVSVLAPIFLCFRYIQPVAHLSNGALAYLPNFCTRLFFMLLPIGIGFMLLNTEKTIIESGNVTFPDLFMLLVSCAFYAFGVMKMKKIAQAITSGQSSLSTINDIIKPAVTAAAEAVAVLVGGAALLEAMPALAGAGAAAGGETMNLGLASRVGNATGAGAPNVGATSLPAPSHEIVPSSAMRMEPPRALTGSIDPEPSAGAGPVSPTAPPTPPSSPGAPSQRPASTANSKQEQTDHSSDATSAHGSETPTKMTSATKADAAPSGSSARDANADTPPIYGDLRPPSAATVFGRSTDDKGSVSWSLSNADELRQRAAAARATHDPTSPSDSGSRATEAPNAPNAGAGASAASRSSEGATKSARSARADASAAAPPPPSSSSSSHSGGSSGADRPFAGFAAEPQPTPASEARGHTAASPEDDAIDASFREIPQPQPTSDKRTHLGALIRGVETYQMATQLLRPGNRQQFSFAALRALRNLERTKNPQPADNGHGDDS